jgi:hypothetical protein
MGSNHGISISGSTVNAGQMVVGDNASASVSQQVSQAPQQVSQRDLVEAIERLLVQLHGSALQGGERKFATEVGETLRVEAKSEKPQRKMLEDGLSMIEKSASSFSGVMKALRLAREVVGLFFGI